MTFPKSGNCWRATSLARWSKAVQCVQTVRVHLSSHNCITSTGKKVTLGYPVPGMNVRLLDAQRRLVPVSITGEISLSGIQMSPGCLGLGRGKRSSTYEIHSCPDRTYIALEILECGRSQWSCHLSGELTTKSNSESFESNWKIRPDYTLGQCCDSASGRNSR
jgi:hypothetical protein